MFSVLIIWLYILAVSYITGYTAIKAFGKGEAFGIKDESAIILAGFLIIMVYSEYFSLFYKVGLIANVLLILFCIVAAILNHKELSSRIISWAQSLNAKKLCAIFVLIILFAYGTSHGYMHYDTDLYHAQSIRWIEEYGVVKGLGNLQTRLAYNSAAFCISALFSFSFLNIQSFHTCAGFLALIVMLRSIDVFDIKSIKVVKLSSFAKIAAIYYILNIFDEMVSPASDYFVILLIFVIAIYYLSLIDDKVNDAYPYALLCLCGLMVFSVKISGSLILLILMYPAYLLIKKRDYTKIIKYILSGILMVVPFIIRNIILSGYLIYPMPGIDIFNFEFKIPKILATYDKNEIEVFGRGHSDLSRIDEPFKDWIFAWFNSLGTINKLCLIFTMIGAIVFVVCIVEIVVKKKYEEIPAMILIGTLYICSLFWMITSPNIRFGCVFIYLTPAVTFGYAYMMKIYPRDRGKIFGVCICAFAVYKIIAFGGEQISNVNLNYMVYQQDYGKYDAIPYELHGITFYYPAEGDRMGYDYFPSAPLKAEDIFLGETIKDGFKDVVHQN